MPKHIDEQKNEEFEKLKVQAEEYLNGWKRALADYENLKKQTQKEAEEFAKFATLNFVISLIPVYDHLKLSFNHLPEEFKNNDWVKGIGHIKNQMKEVLNFNGVEEIVPVIGENFNPGFHEAVENANNTNASTNNVNVINVIKEVLSDGYKLNGRVFKPAKVIVK
ncbi:nucleotide exchange factor GrpE [Candidatus Kuenenbacteria bacterium CG10_big_fil_rev_8_21_14_0_10_36_11]|uniref:Protein GrpE n=1 Tax=Candidatus Kuenenbacteria bacterium CG10_big_fil_rev_8_21_14_0_10_36_11 TaxID=1974618 RepID=A0A2M6WAH4_9BACT|nr:MAG: nucleotide exchange factor GrpE [Candidatus Kuenenbacteria bacterium CG10_big_fil_rev_8_21_14_0_10_36_11]